MRNAKIGFTETESEVNSDFIKCGGWSKLVYEAVGFWLQA
jgi:hypothetical protein